jgi:hypothetical protein
MCALDEPTSLLACATLGLFWAPTPIPSPTELPLRSLLLPGAASVGLPLKLLELTPVDGGGSSLGLSVRADRTIGRGARFPFRSPSLLAVFATLGATCGSRGRGAALGGLDRTVGVRGVPVGGVALAARRGVSGALVVRGMGRVGLPGGGRPWVLRSEDIAGLRG